MYAFDQAEKAHIGRRSREWTAVGPTEVECVREMARCLRAIGAGGHQVIPVPTATSAFSVLIPNRPIAMLR